MTTIPDEGEDNLKMPRASVVHMTSTATRPHHMSQVYHISDRAISPFRLMINDRPYINFVKFRRLSKTCRRHENDNERIVKRRDFVLLAATEFTTIIGYLYYSVNADYLSAICVPRRSRELNNRTGDAMNLFISAWRGAY